MLAIDWGALGEIVLAGACVGLIARLLSLISAGTKRGFNNEIREVVDNILQERESPTKVLAEDLRVGQRRELDRIWAAIDDLRRRADQ